VLLGLIKWLTVLVLLAVIVVAGGLVWMHLEVQRARAPLPMIADLLAVGAGSDLPVKVSVIETSRQRVPRDAVLDRSRDPSPDAPFVMTHPSFVLEWADGRLLLIDAGMSRDAAVDFGAPLERFMGAGAVEPLTTVASALGPAASRVKGIVFTHLHTDHVQGIGELCTRVAPRLTAFMTGAQLDSWTLFTAPGKEMIGTAPCVERTRIGGGPSIALEGFPGVAVIAAAGHTPGSQAIVAAIRDAAGTTRRLVFSGDITNTIDGIRHDVSKPLFYRLVIVPEDDDRLGELRRYLRTLEKEHGFTVVPSHDEIHLRSVGISAWAS
jgi:glyoxylase-like metal-dependent hydrolase (beta-lactamase superfamily II)